MIESLARKGGLTPAEASALAEAFVCTRYAPGDTFVREGQVCTALGLVEQGIWQAFALRGGDEVTTFLATEGRFILSLSSFLQQSPARETIRSLTHSVVWSIRWTDWERLKREIPALSRFYTNMLEEQIVCIDASRFDFITLTAEERYQKMLTDEPELLQRIPLQYLAAVLGVTPRHLSRIRGKKSSPPDFLDKCPAD